MEVVAAADGNVARVHRGALTRPSRRRPWARRSGCVRRPSRVPGSPGLHPLPARRLPAGRPSPPAGAAAALSAWAAAAAEPRASPPLPRLPCRPLRLPRFVRSRPDEYPRVLRVHVRLDGGDACGRPRRCRRRPRWCSRRLRGRAIRRFTRRRIRRVQCCGRRAVALRRACFRVHRRSVAVGGFRGRGRGPRARRRGPAGPRWSTARPSRLGSPWARR